LNYYLDDKEEFMVYINDGNTAIEYLGHTLCGRIVVTVP
jgi:hypothetical protein